MTSGTDPQDPLAGIADDLDVLEALPIAEHAPVYGRIHGALGAALASTAADQADPADDLRSPVER